MSSLKNKINAIIQRNGWAHRASLILRGGRVIKYKGTVASIAPWVGTIVIGVMGTGAFAQSIVTLNETGAPETGTAVATGLNSTAVGDDANALSGGVAIGSAPNGTGATAGTNAVAIGGSDNPAFAAAQERVPPLSP